MQEKFEPESSALSQTLEALEYFNDVHLLEPSTHLRETFKIFSTPKDLSPLVFTEGIKKFIQLSNVNNQDREYKFGGLHYWTDLLQLWTTETNKSFVDTDVYLPIMAPPEWNAYINGVNFAYSYQGEEPAEALNKFLQGPSIVDCGMYCQLAILFGARYVLGDANFNKMFGASPLLITQHLSNDPEKPSWLNNPFYEFFIECENLDNNKLGLTYVSNTPYYPLKHPGGSYMGMNCIVIDGDYFCFDPDLGSSGIKKSEIIEHLRLLFNAPQDNADKYQLKIYQSNGTRLNPGLRIPYSDLIVLAQKFSLKEMDKEEHTEECSQLIFRNSLLFDFKKFFSKAQKILISERQETNSISMKFFSNSHTSAIFENFSSQNNSNNHANKGVKSTV